jgi:sugar O-acyltransferase (sialic acid O-acetyltransferase NeuD family)
MNVIIVGAGGFGKEVAHCLEALSDLNVIGFADDTIEIGSNVIYSYVVVCKVDDLLEISEEHGIVIAVAEPKARKDIYDRISKNAAFTFPNVISSSIAIDSSVILGIGNVFMHGHLQTCNIRIGNFNFFNGGSGIGHDVTIGNFNTFGPRCFIAGNVTIGNCNFFALNSSVLASVEVGSSIRLLLNSTLFKNAKDEKSYYGSPARIVNF